VVYQQQATDSGMTIKLLVWMAAFSVLLAAALVQAQENSLPATVYQTVNVRSGPDTRFEITGQLREGDAVRVDGRDAQGRWLRVVLGDGATGWVPVFVLILEADPMTLPVVGDALPNTPASEGVSVIAYGSVNVRGGPGMGYEIVGQLDVDDRAQAVARSSVYNDWLQIENEAIGGWVAYFTVQVTGDPNTLPVFIPELGETVLPPTLQIATRYNTRLREQPMLDSPVITVIFFDVQVSPLARTEDNEWLYVLYNDQVGWAATRLFVITDEQLEDVPLYVPPEATPDPALNFIDAAIATAEPTAEAP
jgi:N-acetylmuramoyl-L-alanine amidase